MKRFSLVFCCLFSLAAGARAADGDREVVKVNGTPIRQSELVQRLLERYGPETLDGMVDELLLRQELATKKITAPPEEVQRRLNKIKAESGGEQDLEDRLAMRGSSIDKLEKDVTDSLATEKLVIKEKRLSVGEDELKKAFAAHKDELGTPSGVHLKHILVKTKEEADDVLKRLSSGADFKALAKEKSQAPSVQYNAGDDGFVSKGMLPAEIEQAAFAMKPGERQIVPSGKGYSVIEVVEKRKAAAAEFSKVKDDLREMLLGQKVKQALPEIVEELRKKATIEPQGR